MTNYQSNLTDDQWTILSNFFDLKRKRKHGLRDVINAIYYVLKSGCQWRMLPTEFPNWQSVYYYFHKWSRAGLWEDINQIFIHAIREAEQRNEQPTAAIIDSQSVKNTLVPYEKVGYDAGKKIKGIKRHIVTDVLGNLLTVQILPASIQDRDAAEHVFSKMKRTWKKVTHAFADGGYSGKLIERLKNLKITLEIVKRNELHTFKVLPKRWVVERTFSWIELFRRNSKLFERTEVSATAFILLSAMKIMLSRF